MPEIGPMELLVVAVIALIVFGPEKLPDMARKAGNFMADVRRMASDVRTDFDDFKNIDDDDDDDSFDPQDEKSTSASKADETERAKGLTVEPATVDVNGETETVEGPIVHKETTKPDSQDN